MLEKILRGARRVVFFGGAGVSTPSGIPDFRSPGGLFGKNLPDAPDPEMILSKSYFYLNPEGFFNFYRKYLVYPDARPNAAHRWLFELEKRDLLRGIVTQNIDGLHKMAGNRRVYEIHGTVHENYCMDCGAFFPLETVLAAPGIAGFWLFFLLSGLAVSVMDLVQVSKTYDRLKNGIPLDHSPKGKGLLYKYLGRGLMAVSTICLILTFVQLASMKRGDLPEGSDGAYIVISDMGIEGERTQMLGNSSHRENTRSVLSECWNTREYVKTQDGVTISLYQTVYRLSGGLHPENWVETVASSQSFTRKPDLYTAVEIDGLDAAWVAENGIEAIAVKGQFIARIQYLDERHSVRDLADVLIALAMRWNTFE